MRFHPSNTLEWTVSVVVAIVLVVYTEPVLARDNQSEVCHETSSGKSLLLTVGDAALEAHLAHGDWEPVEFFRDTDGDGVGDPDVAIVDCVQPKGYVVNPDDELSNRSRMPGGDLPRPASLPFIEDDELSNRYPMPRGDLPRPASLP